MTQNERILQHLQAGRPITAREAATEYGVMRLAARIYDLRLRGYPIEERIITVRNRFGERVRVAEYYLPEQGRLPL